MASSSTLTPAQAAAPSLRSSSSANTAKHQPVPLHRRLLFPSLPQSDPLPPLLLIHPSSTLDVALYDLLALALRAHVNPWWTRLSRYDRAFVPYLALLLSRVVQAIEARAATADWCDVLLASIPLLVSQHYKDYAVAKEKVGSPSSCATRGSLSHMVHLDGGSLEEGHQDDGTLPVLFHALQKHVALDARGNIDDRYVRHVVDRILNLVLPPEDYACAAERAIVCELLVKIVLYDVAPLLSKPWFIHKMLLDVLRARSNVGAEGADELPPPSSTSSVSSSSNYASVVPPDRLHPSRAVSLPSFHTMVVFVLSTVQYLSGLCLSIIAFCKNAKNTIVLVNASKDSGSTGNMRTEPKEYAVTLLNCTSQMLSVQTRFTSHALFIYLELIVNASCAFLDRLLAYMVHKHVLTERTVLHAVVSAKQTLFPNGYPGPPPVLPTAEEQVEMEEQLVRQLGDLIPRVACSLVFGPNVESRRESIRRALLDPVSDESCNSHLVVMLLDVVVVTMFPELGASMAGGGGGGEKEENSPSSSCSLGSEREVWREK